MTVVAERILELDGVATGALRIEAPKPDPNRDAWRCDYALSWPGYEKQHYAVGIDSYQALSLAMLGAPSMIAMSDEFKAGRIGAFGEKIRTRRELKEVFGIHRLPGFDP